MDSQLMEKEVLCILDTRQIQRFMFRLVYNCSW